MRFGLFSLMPFRDPAKDQRRVFEEVSDQIRLVESLDFDVAWFAEHHFSNYCLCPSPLVMAAYIAARTERIRLGTAVLVLPLYEPVRLIEELALVDVLSHGRLVVGIGSGYQDYEFQHFRQRLEDSKAVFGEVLDLLELGLSGGEVSYAGHHFTQPATPFALRGIQQPLPEIWVAGIREDRDIQLRVARSGYVPFGTAGWNGAEALLDFRRKYEDAYRAVGKDPARMPFAVQRYVFVAEDKRDAREFADHVRYTGRVAMGMRNKTSVLDGAMLREIPVPGEPTIEQILDRAIIGDVETCIETAVGEIRTLRPSHLSCFIQPGAMDQKRVLRSMELFGTKVIPGIERELGPLADVGAPIPRPTPAGPR
jgi:alkanesulfonate monooxygenase SsuD/methylene tetrahydromethanopterin reductase-like flavin-dependent oxidoreductase (luciferase family)